MVASFARELLHVVPEPVLSSQAELLATIHERIIPQLVLAHYADPVETPLCLDARLPPTDQEIADFAEIAVLRDLPNALAFVEQIVREGVSLDIVLLNLVAPAARLLGEQWEDDTRTFTDVTLGLVTLQQVVHVIGPGLSPKASGGRGVVVLASPLREQHTLGLHLLAEFLRRAEWTVEVAPTLSVGELIMLVGSERIDVVGISVKDMDCLDALSDLVGALKKASANADLVIMVGGTPLLSTHAVTMGCTYCADADDAVRWLDRHARRLKDAGG